MDRGKAPIMTESVKGRLIMMTFARFGYDINKRKGIFAVSALALLMSACATTDTGQTPTPTGPVVNEVPVIPETRPQPTEPETEPEAEKEVEETQAPIATGPYFNNRKGVTLPHMEGRDTKRLALLLPFSARSSRLREEAASMMKAAELSVFERDAADVLLLALDTGGTEQGARTATQAAIKAGADVILGPILASSVPVLAFSTDQTVAGNGAYLLSFPPEAEVERIVDFAAQSGTTRFAFLGPDSAYGRRVQAAYDRAIKERGGEITAVETYQGRDISVMQEPAQRLATFHRQAEREARQNEGLTPMAFEAIILPEGGTALRSLAPLLPFYDIDPADVQFLGTGLWKNDETVREPALSGGVFAGPDPDAQAQFEANFDRAFGEETSRLASLAYDAVVIGAYVADGDPRARRARMEDAQGFYGVDGAIRFGKDGRPQRGLAVYQIQNGRFLIVDPAPTSVSIGPS